MQKKSIATVCASIALSVFAVGCVNVGDLASNVPGATGTTKSAGSVDLSGHQDKLLRSYVAAGEDVLTANKHMAIALGVNAEAVDAAAKAASVAGDNLEDREKAISSVAQLTANKQKLGAQTLSAAAKAKYAQGLVSLATGVKKYAGMRKDVQSFSSGLSSVSPLQLGKLQTGVYIVKNLPTNISNLSTTLSGAIDFAKQNNIPLPKGVDATNALGD